MQLSLTPQPLTWVGAVLGTAVKLFIVIFSDETHDRNSSSPRLVEEFDASFVKPTYLASAHNFRKLFTSDRVVDLCSCWKERWCPWT